MENLLPLILRRIGVIGAFAYSGANFCLAILLQFHVGSAEFGLYAFALVLIQLGMGLSNALFAAPIVVWFEDRSVDRQALVRSFALANLVFIGLGALILATVLLAIGMPGLLVGLVSALAVALWLRWFCRAVELANHNFVWSAGADMAYGGVTLLAGGAFFYWFDIDVFWALVAMLAGTLASMAVIGKGVLAQVFARGRVSLSLFLRSFRSHGFWATVGVTTTEITTNLHSYVLTLWLGPAAFAPVATLSLFFRPIPILMQALTQFERPVLARTIRDGATGQLVDAIRNISALMTGAVLLNTLAIAAILAFAEGVVGAGQYAPQELWPLLVLLAVVQLVRGLRTGHSAAAQGAGLFRPLALATLIAAPVTCAGTLAALAIGWQVVPMVLVGVLAGEVVTAILIRRVFNRLVLVREVR